MNRLPPAIITCNSCDAISEVTQANSAGYCRECWAEVQRNGSEAT